MKKVALCLSVITLMFTGVTGCGDVNNANVEGQNYGLQGRNQHGLQQGYTADGTGMGAHHYGQDGMLPRGAGTDQGRVITDTGAGYGRGVGAGHDGRGGFMQGGADPHLGGHQGMMTRDERYGTGAQVRDGHARGFRAGQNRRDGFTRGITGNDRRGMVDSNGLLNGRMRGLDRTNGHSNRRQDQMHGGTAIERNQPRAQQGDGQQRGFGQGKGQQQAYYDSDDGRLASRIENRVEGLDEVRDCDVIVNNDNVIIGVEPEGNNGQVEDRVRSLVDEMDNDKQVHIVTERTGVERIHDMENRLRDGEPFEEVGATFNAMLDDLGDAIQRPFERTR
ncbi:YhcN/YlaJ family sporulation lipoprotein [Salipaludibacillus sp. LMS25]|jgi:hypothetical protein|uniref:YhcN/YlaJ family sporulation lipoprotein n=1 Tax=Salipaludibacillus sp. LMS25 TaxID=2924031 RepID=UPI0020D19E58|nr:YhcN/YlaJ family sporulation lipoprotein [Salipaludibacillus sp. LMS25]UTR14239.1 YhcN/YlaJ family sporulation lipoprotein [Salipaludibacillus sp. LMS25]